MAHNILIIGATGNIGKYITEKIVADKASFRKLGILTSKSTIESKAKDIEALKAQGVEIFDGGLGEKSVKSVYEKGFDTVVSAVGRGAIGLQTDLIKWASESPTVKWFFPSEYGTDIEHNAQSPNEKPHQLKLQVRAFARTIKPSDLHFTYLVTGPYSDMFFYRTGRDEIGTFDVKAKRAVLLGDGEGKVALTSMADVGKFVVAALKHPSASQDKILIVNSFTVTPHQIIAEFEKQTGAKWNISYISLDKLKEIEKNWWETGEPYATGATLRRIWTEGGTLYDRERDNGVIGVKDEDLETLEDQVRQAVEAQTKAREKM